MCGWGWGGMGLGRLHDVRPVGGASGGDSFRGGLCDPRGRSWGGQQIDASPATRPGDVLAQRFARGEIDEDEYRRSIAVLREHREHI